MTHISRSYGFSGYPTLENHNQDASPVDRLQYPSLINRTIVKYSSMDSTFSVPREFVLSRASASSRIPDGLEFYEPGRISLGRLAELCGLYYDEVIEKLTQYGKELKFGPETVEEAEKELKLIDQHMKKES